MKPFPRSKLWDRFVIELNFYDSWYRVPCMEDNTEKAKTMSEFNQRKFNVHVVKVLQALLENISNFDKPLADDFGVLCELLWTYDPKYSEFTTKDESK